MSDRERLAVLLDRLGAVTAGGLVLTLSMGIVSVIYGQAVEAVTGFVSAAFFGVTLWGLAVALNRVREGQP